VVDVGGGYGQLAVAILRAHPHLRGLVFDLPHALEGARALAAKAAMAQRCEFASGSFFDSIPAGGDVHILKSIVHNWPDERSVQILRNSATPRCRRAGACCWSSGSCRSA
jgi:16S rRNA G1207 methylase RsmC